MYSMNTLKNYLFLMARFTRFYMVRLEKEWQASILPVLVFLAVINSTHDIHIYPEITYIHHTHTHTHAHRSVCAHTFTHLHTFVYNETHGHTYRWAHLSIRADTSVYICAMLLSIYGDGNH